MSEKAVKTIGVLTSGGDAPGMNAAIRAVVRAGLSSGLKVKGIRRGYAGLLEEDIVDMDTMSVSDIVQKGGTILYTSRCPEMVTPEGQKKAADICRKRSYWRRRFFPRSAETFCQRNQHDRCSGNNRS